MSTLSFDITDALPARLVPSRDAADAVESVGSQETQPSRL